MGLGARPEPLGVLLQVGDGHLLRVLGQFQRGPFTGGVLMEFLQGPPFVLRMLVDERLVGAGKLDRPRFRRGPHVPRSRPERLGFPFHGVPWK
jgi:hypothetical protein